MVLYEDNKAKYDAVSKDLFRLVQRDEKIHDVEFKTNASGILVSADGDTDVSSYAEEPEEPYCVED